MLEHLLLAFQLVAMPNYPARTAEVQQRALIDSAKQHEREVRARRELEQRQFELKFNQLVVAVESFAKRYNEDKGKTWPLREVEKLRQAMRELQAVERSLQGERSLAQVNAVSPGHSQPPKADPDNTAAGATNKAN